MSFSAPGGLQTRLFWSLIRDSPDLTAEETWSRLFYPFTPLLREKNHLLFFFSERKNFPTTSFDYFIFFCYVCVLERRDSALLVAVVTWYSGEVQS